MSLLMEAAKKWMSQLNARFDTSTLTQLQYEQLLKAFSLSDFIADSVIKQPSLILSLFEDNLLSSPQRTQSFICELGNNLDTVETEAQLHRVLREFRRKHMVIIAWRELFGLSTLDESFDHISALADQLIVQSLDWLYELQCKEQGIPIGESGKPQQMYIFTMGKLGGKELNFSSDIDLIFTYPESGETQGGRRRVENSRFFTKLGQRLIAALHQITVDGFVYRVDMRLRPFGDSGPLVSTFSSLEDYYQTHGREWERYAMIKARILGQEGEYKQQLISMLKPFVFRRYIDFSAIESLRKMKALISAEVRRKGLIDNIKLGMGGIREIEFVVQAFQLIHGGREPMLQCKGLQQTLSLVGELGLMPKKQVEHLLNAYRFLRSVENILQQIGDKQTQTLPVTDLDKRRVITVLKFIDWDCFYSRLNKEMARVHDAFNWVIGESVIEQSAPDKVFMEIWELELTNKEIVPLLLESTNQKVVSVEQYTALSQSIVFLKQEISKRPIGPRGQETIDKLMPRMLFLICSYDHPELLFERIQQLLLSIMSRTAYLELLNENEGALNQLLTLCSASPRISEQLARHPILLDELLDPQKLYYPTKLHDYKSELQQFMLRIPEEDMEQQMEALRQFKQMQFLHIATADIAGGIQLPEVSDHLTYLSEAILDYVVQIAWAQVVDKFGLPSNVAGSNRKGFAVIGYGKMGGYELGYGSDLDVVFLHESNIGGNTNGDRSIENQLFYFRFAQRIIHLFSTRTNSGVLYEIDMRLRPSGDAGSLVASMSGFLRYLKEDAWTWEHQALVRTRPVYIEPELVQDFAMIRAQILSMRRDIDTLRADVLAMRSKMRAHLNQAVDGQFDFKQSPGGMVDIEFIAQYLVLANAHQFPVLLTEWSDNLRIFSACKEVKLLTVDQVDSLVTVYCHIRDEAHRLALDKETRITALENFKEDSEAIIAIWEQLFLTHDI